MEDILELYAAPPDPRRPRVCLDEKSYQLLAEVHPSSRPAPGEPARQDYEYARQGNCNLFVLFQPEMGSRHVTVTDRRTTQDFARQLKALVDTHYPDAEVIRLVTDNLNTHRPACLYATFPPAEARRIARKLEWHYTPKHASWLNQVEIEIGILDRQCLDRRLPDRTTLEREVAAWEADRNAAKATIDWRFQCADARTKLSRLYPTIPE